MNNKIKAEERFTKLGEYTDNPFLVAYYKTERADSENPYAELYLADMSWPCVDLWKKTASTQARIDFRCYHQDRPIYPLFGKKEIEQSTIFSSAKGRILVQRATSTYPMSYKARWWPWGVEMVFTPLPFSMTNLHMITEHLGAFSEAVTKLRGSVKKITIAITALIAMVVPLATREVQEMVTEEDPVKEVATLTFEQQLLEEARSLDKAGLILWAYRGEKRYPVAAASNRIKSAELKKLPPQNINVTGWNLAYQAHLKGEGYFLDRDDFASDTAIYNLLAGSGLETVYLHPVMEKGKPIGYISTANYKKPDSGQREQIKLEMGLLVNRLETPIIKELKLFKV